jgi:hypothetical protein
VAFCHYSGKQDDCLQYLVYDVEISNSCLRPLPHPLSSKVTEESSVTTTETRVSS